MPYLNSESIQRSGKKIGYITYRTDDKENYNETILINSTEYQKIAFEDSNGTVRFYKIREPAIERNINGKDQYTKDSIEYREDLQSILSHKLNKSNYTFVNKFLKKNERSENDLKK